MHDALFIEHMNQSSDDAIEDATSQLVRENSTAACLTAAYAIDAEAIAKERVASQWIPFEEKWRLIEGEIYLILTTGGTFATQHITYKVLCEYIGDGAMFYQGGEGVIISWLCAFPLKALGV
jgi:D-serine deaminase-like pyridoxal phosphate-dependent protein